MSVFSRTLTDFGRYVRDPHHVRRPLGLSSRRGGVYPELLFNNLADVLDACFPVCRQMLGSTRWRGLQRRFMRDWPSQTPWFREIPQEFLLFLGTSAGPCHLPAWFAELAHYEWAELAVELMDCPRPRYRATGDLMRQPIVLNPALMNLAYRWPVHRIGTAFRPRQPEDTRLAIYRDTREAVCFCLLTPASARLLGILGEGKMTGRAAVACLAEELRHPRPESLLAHATAELGELRRVGLLLGVEI